MSPITLDKIISHIKSVTTKTATHEQTQFLRKHLKTSKQKTLEHAFNTFLLMAIFTNILKESIVILIYKNGNIQEKMNYRLISLTSS